MWCDPKDHHLYCNKRLGKGVLPRCPLLEQIFNDTTALDIFYSPTWTKPPQPTNTLATIGWLIETLSWWINEKVEPGYPVFWFYAYVYGPCKRRAMIAVGFNILDDLITKFNYSHPAIAAEIKELASNLVKKAIAWDESARFKQQQQCWINISPSKTILVNPVEVKRTAAALRHKLQLIGSLVQTDSTKQKNGRNKKHRKYTVEQLRRVRATFDQRRDGGMDVKGAWNEAAEAFGIKSGKAAEMVCRRYLKNQNK